MVELLIEFRDILILLLGAGLGFILSRVGVKIESTARRQLLSTAALAELRWLDGILREIVEKGPSAYDDLRHPALTALVAEVHIFDVKTVKALADFQAQLRDVQEGNIWYSANRQDLVGRRE